MKQRICFLVFATFLVATVFFASQDADCEEPKLFIPEKALCAKMLRFGKQAYQMGRYLDAKEYFRKSIQADPDSPAAWRHYDMAAIFALAEKVKKNANLTAPDVSVRTEQRPGAIVPSTPPPQSSPSKEVEFKIEDDEGC